MKTVSVLKLNAPVIFAGLISAVCYSSMVLTAMFLIPIQYIAVRRDYKAMLNSSALSIVFIALWNSIMMIKAGAIEFQTFFSNLTIPVVLVLAILLIALPRFTKVEFVIRVIAVSVLATLVSIPFLFAFINDSNTEALFIDMFTKAGLFNNAPLDPPTLWAAVKNTIFISFTAMLFLLVFFSAWIGTMFGLRSNGGIKSTNAFLPPDLMHYQVPKYLVWSLIFAWALLLANRFFNSFIISVASLNVALVLSICYGVQGLAVLRALSERRGMATAYRIVLTLVIVLILFNRVIALLFFGILVLFGTLETWIPFRAANKGDVP